MRIGIIGTGNMGRTLGGIWASAGHEVFFGARKPEIASEAEHLARAQATSAVGSGTNQQAAEFGDVLLYCPRAVDPQDVLCNASVLGGKVLIDLNNVAIPSGFRFETHSESLAEKLQRQAPDAVVAKAFNMLAQEVFGVDRAEREDKGVSVLIATDDPEARNLVEILARDLGLTPVNAGPLRNARLLESAADLVRYLIGGAGLGPLATLSVRALSPGSAKSLYGGRRASTLQTDEGHRNLPRGQPVEVESSGVIDASLESVWNLVSDFNSVARWHPDVTESRLESGKAREAGAVRLVHLRNGMAIRERLVAISPEDHFYKYAVIESPLPLREHESTVRFIPINESRTQVTWTARFEVIAGDAKAFGEAVKTGVLDLGIDGLRKAALG